MSRLAIVGAGSWGTALAHVLAPRFEEVRLWVFESDLAVRIRETGINDVFLAGVVLPANVRVSDSLAEVLEGAETVLTAVPSHVVRGIYSQVRPLVRPSVPLVSATKGLEEVTLLRMSQVIREVMGDEYAVGVLSGPSFARDVAASNPTALVIASENARLAREIQERFSGPVFRLYDSADPIGAEIGGSLKNVIAIGAGISDGLGLGHNAIAALITRGLAELTRLAVALGARSDTLAGLAGLGDLVLTCTGNLSRNRQVGIKLASGLGLEEIVNSTPMVAEGVKTTHVAMELARRYGVDLPIAREMNEVLSGNRSPREAIQRLMTRTLRSEVG